MKSQFDKELKLLGKDIQWSQAQKNKLKNEILFTIDREGNKTTLFTRLKYPLSIGFLAILLAIGLVFLFNNTSQQTSPGDQDNQVVNPEQDDEKEKEQETDDEQETKQDAEQEEDKESNTEEGAEQQNEDSPEQMTIHTGENKRVPRSVEGMEEEFTVIEYRIEPYGISYQLDELLGSPQQNDNKITYSHQEGYQINIEVLEDTDLNQAVTDLQASIEAEGVEESLPLEDIPVDENNLTGKMQYFYSPIKGFFAYEIDQHVLAITFQYPEEAGDGMGPLLHSLRTSIAIE